MHPRDLSTPPQSLRFLGLGRDDSCGRCGRGRVARLWFLCPSRHKRCPALCARKQRAGFHTASPVAFHDEIDLSQRFDVLLKKERMLGPPSVARQALVSEFERSFPGPDRRTERTSVGEAKKMLP